MRTIFLADAHLNEPAEPNYRLLLRFLGELTGNTEALFIMGDLFDFWVGFPSHHYRHYDEVLDALHLLENSGCRIVYFEGNHDFHLGPVFQTRIKAEVHRDPETMTVQGKRLYLCHGDQVNRADWSYRILRFILHNPLSAASVALWPPSLAFRIRNHLQCVSRSTYRSDAVRWNYRDIIHNFATTLQKRGYDGMVTGHFHTPFIEHLENPGFSCVSLGDWIGQFSYAEMINGDLLLYSYSPE